MQYVDEHVLVAKGKLKRHCVLCAEKKKQQLHVSKMQPRLMDMFCFTPYHT